MRPFLDEDFLLDTQTARALYHGVAEGMPILDYHCHVSPREIAEDRVFRHPDPAVAGGGPLQMAADARQRCAGAAHHRSAPDEEKFQAWAATLERSGGQSPLSLEPFGAQAIFRL